VSTTFDSWINLSRSETVSIRNCQKSNIWCWPMTSSALKIEIYRFPISWIW